MPTQIMTPRQHRLWWQSSYDRGIQHLLKMWPQIRAKYPDAELWITYGWDLFVAGYANNPERMAWRDRIEALMQQDGITHYGRVNQKRLAELRKQCGIWAYPTEFTEINCISALECQRDGCVPVVINLAALAETVQSGIKVDGDIYDEETYEEYLNQLLALMGDEERWKVEQTKGKEWASQFEWSTIADEWAKQFV